MSLCAPSGFSASVAIPVENVVTRWVLVRNRAGVGRPCDRENLADLLEADLHLAARDDGGHALRNDAPALRRQLLREAEPGNRAPWRCTSRSRSPSSRWTRRRAASPRTPPACRCPAAAAPSRTAMPIEELARSRRVSGRTRALRGERVQARPRHDQHVEALPPRQPDRDRVRARRRSTPRTPSPAGCRYRPRTAVRADRRPRPDRPTSPRRPRRAPPPGPPAVRSRTGMRRPRASARGRAATASATQRSRWESARARPSRGAGSAARAPVSAVSASSRPRCPRRIARRLCPASPWSTPGRPRADGGVPLGRRHSGRRNAISPATSPPTVSAMCWRAVEQVGNRRAECAARQIDGSNLRAGRLVVGHQPRPAVRAAGGQCMDEQRLRQQRSRCGSPPRRAAAGRDRAASDGCGCGPPRPVGIIQACSPCVHVDGRHARVGRLPERQPARHHGAGGDGAPDVAQRRLLVRLPAR